MEKKSYKGKATKGFKVQINRPPLIENEKKTPFLFHSDADPGLSGAEYFAGSGPDPTIGLYRKLLSKS